MNFFGKSFEPKTVGSGHLLAPRLAWLLGCRYLTRDSSHLQLIKIARVNCEILENQLVQVTSRLLGWPPLLLATGHPTCPLLAAQCYTGFLMTHPRPSLPQGQLLYMQVRVMTILPAARIVGPKNARKQRSRGVENRWPPSCTGRP